MGKTCLNPWRNNAGARTAYHQEVICTLYALRGFYEEHKPCLAHNRHQNTAWRNESWVNQGDEDSGWQGLLSSIQTTSRPLPLLSTRRWNAVGAKSTLVMLGTPRGTVVYKNGLNFQPTLIFLTAQSVTSCRCDLSRTHLPLSTPTSFSHKDRK